MLLRMNEDVILNARQMGEVIHILQRTIHHMYDPDGLLRVTFDKIGSMTSNSITKERKKQEPAVMAELNQRLQRLNSLETNSYHPWAAHVHECRCGWSMPTTSKMVQGFIPMCKDQRNRNVNRLSLVSKNCKKKNIPL